MQHPVENRPIVERLRHAATTACNDDMSEPMSEKRTRHIRRVQAMRDGADEIEAHERSSGIMAERIRDQDAEIERLREAIEDAINTLESMSLHTDNPLYDRLCAALER